MRKGEFEFSIFWNLCEKIPWENLTVEAMHAASDHPRPQRPLCQPTRRPVALWGCTTADNTAIVCEIFRRQITMDLMHWRIMTLRRLKYTQIIITTLSLGKWVRDDGGTAFYKTISCLNSLLIWTQPYTYSILLWNCLLSLHSFSNDPNFRCMRFYLGPTWSFQINLFLFFYDNYIIYHSHTEVQRINSFSVQL